MCGILAVSSKDSLLNQELIYKMLHSISHRGKDFNGCVFLNNNNDAIGHCRLSLIDLSANANQPISNENATIYLSFNGEIYNYKELRDELISYGHKFKSSGDAEVLIHGYEQWGINVLHRLNGMYAFIIYDSIKKEYLCARDRIGIKPLYYTHFNNVFIVSSEIKPILIYPDYKSEINYYSISDYFTYRYIPSPNTIYKNIYKLPPACYIIYNQEKNKVTEPIEYWLLKPSQQNYKGNIVHEVKELLLSSVRKHLLSDVPIGIFLSGGIDSTTIAFIASESNYKPIAFSLGFENWYKSENIIAKKTATTLNIPFKEKIINDSSFENILESIYYYDEPIADISIIPTYEICRFASKHVNAVLSGEGGDELFAGYNWHQKLMKIQSLWFAKIKPDAIIKYYAKSMSMGLFDNNELKKILHPFYHSYINDDVFYFYKKHYIKDIHPLKAVQYLDLKTFLSELVLTKVDRASMAHTIEVRVPYLDHKIVEFMFSLNTKIYFKRNKQKHILCEIIKNKVPMDILKLPKQGFVGPDDFYYKKHIYEKYLNNSELVKNQIIQKHTIEKYFETDDYWRIWKIFVLEIWFRKWMLKK
jgi:asparagine synthase (glutamine-hydrolysing)